MRTSATNPLTRYQADPCLFAKEILGVQLEPYQEEILRSVCNNPRTAVRSANGVGKTFISAVIVLWAVCCFTNAVVVTTASTNRQVEMQLWGEIRQLYRGARAPLGGELLNTELRFEKTNSRAVGFSTNDPGLFEGWHSERVLVVVDEAKSVEQPIFDAVERVLAAGQWVRLLVASTPGGPCGPFYDCFTKSGHLYVCHHISAMDSPFIRPAWIEERKREWGEGSALYESAVLGEFPTHSQDGVLIPLAILQRLLENPPDPSGSELRAGIDLAAGGGDETVVTVFHGNQQVALECWHETDTMATVGRIIGITRQFGLRPENINVDADGMGSPVIDRLWEQGFKVNRIHNGGEPTDRERYFNYAAEAWANLAQKIERDEIILKADAKLIAQLTSRKLKPRSDGRLQLESKEEMRRRGLPSPDRAEAIVYALSQMATQNAINQANVIIDLLKRQAARRAGPMGELMKGFFPGYTGVIQNGHHVSLGELSRLYRHDWGK
jgi:hypothetical protein